MEETSKRSPLLKMPPPFWLLFFLIVGLTVHYFVPSAQVFSFPLPILGTVLALAGTVLTLYASSIFSKEKTEIYPTSPTNRVLVTYGPFSYIRNPMYLGMVMFLLGIGFYLGTLPLFLAALAHFLVLNFAFIPFEERKMARIFGAAYEAYKSRVRRWI